MISQSVKRRVQELMLDAKGDKTKVERLIKTLTEQDAAFLKELTDPYMKGIIAHAISVSGSPPAKREREPDLAKSAAPMDQVMHKLRQNFGAGMEEAPTASSARHTENIHKLIKAQASKRREK